MDIKSALRDVVRDTRFPLQVNIRYKKEEKQSRLFYPEYYEEALKAKNPHIRIVINAISMETICEIKEILAAYDMKNEDIVQLQVSRSKQIGHYHLMQAENPVWICSFEF